MKTTAIAITCLCLALTGCANTYTYAKDGVNHEATHADMMVCKSVMSSLTGDEAKDAFDKCMADKGYEKKVDKYHL